MKVKIKDGGIYRTVEISSAEYGLYLKKGYVKVVDEPIVKEEPKKIKIEEPKQEEIEKPKSKKKKA